MFLAADGVGKFLFARGMEVRRVGLPIGHAERVGSNQRSIGEWDAVVNCYYGHRFERSGAFMR